MFLYSNNINMLLRRVVHLSQMSFKILEAWHRSFGQLPQCIKKSLMIITFNQIPESIVGIFAINLLKHQLLESSFQLLFITMQSENPPENQPQQQNDNNHNGNQLVQAPVQIEQQIIQQRRQVGGGSQPIVDEGSLQERVQSGQDMVDEEGSPGDMQNRTRKLMQKTQLLHADEEFLKQELKVREKQTLATYDLLMQRKKQLLQLVIQTYNRNVGMVDIGLSEEMDELKKIILGQEQKIQQLKKQISTQGLAGVLTDDKQVRIKTKTEEVEKQYKVGRKFSSTQYVRDYLQRPQAYKVSYQESKYQYELRVRLKQSLQQEKKLYEKKKQELNQAKRKQRERQHLLHKQKDQWS